LSHLNKPQNWKSPTCPKGHDRVLVGTYTNGSCKPCKTEYSNSESVRLARRDRDYLKKFGITLEDYNKMFFEQEGKCFICNKHQSEEERALAVDHNHRTGKVRHLLCMKCNMVVGILENLELVKKVNSYIQGNF
jgi:uncharacterized DUF497 family protein